MKLTLYKPFKGLASVTAFIMLMLTMASANSYAQGDPAKGEAIFKANCASCHHPVDVLTGPALKGAKGRWEAAGEGANIYPWIKNSVKLAESGTSPYATEMAKFDASVMTAQAVSDEEIDHVLAYVDAYSAPEPVAGLAECYVAKEKPKKGGWKWMLILAIVLAVAVFALVGVNRKLKEASPNYDTEKDMTYLEMVKDWFFRNKVFGGLAVAFVVVMILLELGGRAFMIDVNEGYEPSQPIAFSHCVHAGNQEIDCKYCHNSVEKSKHAGIPSGNICMNCHKNIKEGTYTGASQIAKIYDAVGWDVEARSYITDENGNRVENPIIWNKVHNLPDHVYFNHSQHVKVGGVDCIQCHGDMTNLDVARVRTVEEINELEGTVKLTKPVLTMGWCIECHNETGVDVESGKNAYYTEIHERLKKDPELLKKYKEDDKITVRELGGWECAKCHY